MNPCNRVYALMELTPKSDLRYAMPAIRSFSMQTWPYRTLYVICHDGVRTDEVSAAIAAMGLRDPDIEVRKAPHTGTLDEVLTRRIVERSGKSWGVLWPPECWNHPDRLTFQLASAVGDSAVRLASEIRLSPAEAACRVLWSLPPGTGIASTELFPLGSHQLQLPSHPYDAVTLAKPVVAAAFHPWPLRIRFLPHNVAKGPDPAEASLFYRDLPTGFLSRGKTQVPDHVREGLPDILKHYGLGLFTSPPPR